MIDPFIIPADINQHNTIIPPVAQTEKISLGLYVGDGAGENGVRNVKLNIQNTLGIEIVELTAEDIAGKNLSVFDVIIFPGGRARKQAEALGQEGKEKIRNFVQNGGGYLGICAGMYLAITGFDWALHILDAKTKTAVDEWKRGRGFVDVELTEEGKKVLNSTSGIFKSRYNNGPIIQSMDNERVPYTVAAYFRSEISENDTPEGIMINTPAAAFTIYGKGKVFVTSTHAENTPGLENFIPQVLFWLKKVK